MPEGVLGGAGRAADSEPVTAGRSSGMTDEQIRETVRNARVELDSDENIACYSFIFDPDYADCVPFFDKQKECWDWIGGGDVAKLPVDLFDLAPLCLDEARAIRAALEAMPPEEWLVCIDSIDDTVTDLDYPEHEIVRFQPRTHDRLDTVMVVQSEDGSLQTRSFDCDPVLEVHALCLRRHKLHLAETYDR